MRKVLGVAALLAVVVPLAVAQTGQDSARLAPDGAGPVEAAATRPAPRTSARYGDARHCLDFPTNTQVIVCAEKYLPGRAGTP